MATIENKDGVIILTDDSGATLETNPIMSTDYDVEVVKSWLSGDWTIYSVDWTAEAGLYGRVVSINGLFRNGANGTTIMTLPEELRPKTQFITIQRTSNGTQRVDFYPDGRIVASASGDRVASGDWLSVVASYIVG